MNTKLVEKLGKIGQSEWYLPLAVVLAFFDAYIFVVPNEALLIVGVLARPKQWIYVVNIFAFGSSLGMTTLAYMIAAHGPEWLEWLRPGTVNSALWMDAMQSFKKDGVLGLFLVTLSPFPLHIPVAIAGLSGLSIWKIFGTVFLGKVAKYLVFGRSAILGKKLIASGV